MTGLMKFVFLNCNPVYWALWMAYSLTLRLPVWLFCLPYNTWKTGVRFYNWTMNTFTSWYSRLIVGAIALYVLIPGSMPYAFYKIAQLAGYEKEAEIAKDIVVTVASAAWTAGKFAFTYALS